MHSRPHYSRPNKPMLGVPRHHHRLCQWMVTQRRILVNLAIRDGMPGPFPHSKHMVESS